MIFLRKSCRSSLSKGMKLFERALEKKRRRDLKEDIVIDSQFLGIEGDILKDWGKLKYRKSF